MNPANQYRLQKIFRELFDQPNLVLTADLSPATVEEWDSVAMVQLVLAAEQEFSVRLTTDEVASVRSAGDLLRLVEVKAP